MSNRSQGHSKSVKRKNAIPHHRPVLRWRVNFVTLVAGIGFGAVMGSSLITVLPNVGTPGGAANALGSMCAMVGTYLCLMLLVNVTLHSA